MVLAMSACNYQVERHNEGPGMIDVLMQILVITVIAGFPLVAIAANFMRHRLDQAVDGPATRSDSAVEDGLYPLVLPYRETSHNESKRAA